MAVIEFPTRFINDHQTARTAAACAAGVLDLACLGSRVLARFS
jgi:hypothetical protein